MDINSVYSLMDRFENSGITGMKLEMEGMKLSLTKEAASQSRQVQEGDGFLAKEKSIKTEKASDFEIKAPLTGTFYRAASVNAEPFTAVGRRVAKGDVIGIIEAMKMMNEVISPVEGEVVEIRASDEEMVEYDQVLITVKEF